MKTLFTDIYNKIMDLFQIERSENTSECAANRLQVILMHDRTKLDPLIMSKMREELIDVFSKYVVIDKEELEIGLKNEGDAVALMLNIPIVRAKTEEELEEIRKKLQAEETKVSDDDDEDETETNAEENKSETDEKKEEEKTEETKKEETSSEERNSEEKDTDNKSETGEKKEEVIETVQGEVVEEVPEEAKKEEAAADEKEEKTVENIVDAVNSTVIKSDDEKNDKK